MSPSIGSHFAFSLDIGALKRSLVYITWSNRLQNPNPSGQICIFLFISLSIDQTWQNWILLRIWIILCSSGTLWFSNITSYSSSSSLSIVFQTTVHCFKTAAIICSFQILLQKENSRNPSVTFHFPTLFEIKSQLDQALIDFQPSPYFLS